MGWPWSSKESRNDDQLPPSTQSSPESFHQDSFPLTDDAATKRPLTRDEAADAELLEILKAIQDEPTPQAPEPILSKARSQTTIPYSVPESTPTSEPITPASIHPTTMSCRAAFDHAFYCQSLGGQFNSIYRQGTVRSCGHLWADFWFCVRMNRGWMSDSERKERVLERYRRKERKYVDGPSSEDVWKARKTMVVGAFEGDFEAVEDSLALLEREKGMKLFWDNKNKKRDSET
ncbi:hypothetical protein MMC29_007917 [Sticta canariensis]|nr:hypothetical protein [Sticta canariensis]